MKLKDMEAPAKLTIVRLALIPLFMIFTVYGFGMDGGGKFTWPRIIAASLFLLTCIVHFVDSRLMRGRDITKGFWAFLDVVADRMVIFSALFAICFSGYVLEDGFYRNFFFWSTAVIVFREFVVLGICLTESSLNVDYLFDSGAKLQRILLRAASFLQGLCVVVVILEPIMFSASIFCNFRLLSLIVTSLTVAASVVSCLYGIIAYKNYIIKRENGSGE